MPTAVSTYSPNYTHAEDGTPLLWLCTACAVAVSCCDYSSDNSPASEDVEALGLVTFYESGWDDQEESFRCDCCDQDAYCVPTLFAPEVEEIKPELLQLKAVAETVDPLLVAARESYEIAADTLKSCQREQDWEATAYHARAMADHAEDLKVLEALVAYEDIHGTTLALEVVTEHAERRAEDPLSFLSRCILRARGVDIHALQTEEV